MFNFILILTFQVIKLVQSGAIKGPADVKQALRRFKKRNLLCEKLSELELLDAHLVEINRGDFDIELPHGIEHVISLIVGEGQSESPQEAEDISDMAAHPARQKQSHAPAKRRKRRSSATISK